MKAEEDLYLTGSESTIRRVTAETNYSCLMLKTQRFSSLFRHYAKYHGLRKDDLEYYFVNPLENEDTPESVQLQRGDTIMVRKKRKVEPPEAASDDEEFFRDMKELLDDEEHMDTVFLVHPEPSLKSPPKSGSHLSKLRESKSENYCVADAMVISTSNEMSSTKSAPLTRIRAHKCILTARAEYFKAFFRKSACDSGDTTLAFRESTDCIIDVEPSFSAKIIQLMLEFIYTNRIQTISDISSDDLLCLLHLSDKWLLRDLKRCVELELIRSHMDVNTVARLYCATADYQATRLQRTCIDFIMENIREVTGNVAFQEEMKHYPHLCIPVLKAAADLIPEPVHKKQRTSDHGCGSNATPGAAVTGSPVPDSDT